ncbi:hypothetical protein A6P54_09070 [Bacillus sp. MKU004]|nr:hypothetical protein A6P54_09070 [Bacillus sp. MKU004]
MVISKQVKMVTGINLLIVSGLAKKRVNQGKRNPIKRMILIVIKKLLFHLILFILAFEVKSIHEKCYTNTYSEKQMNEWDIVHFYQV